jgi:arylsulfatase A-like enzyme
MKRALRATAAALPAAWLLACRAVEPGLPNVLLVTVDALRLERIGSYGGVPGVTPNLDGLAAEGVRFESVQAPRGLTWPSLTTLLTGLHPRTHGVRQNGSMLSEEFATLPEILSEAGFDTGRFLANMCDAPDRGLRVSFCAWWEGGERSSGSTRERLASHDQPLWDAAVTREALAFLRAPREEPFFAWVHYMDPHKPFDPVAEFLRPSHDGSFPVDDASLKSRTRSRRPLRDEERRQLLAVYDSQVAAVDAQIGRLLAALEDTGQAARTLVVFSADHGEELGDHNAYFFHRDSVYEQVLAVPLIVRWPGRLPAGAEVAVPIAGVDVAPTILELLGIDPGVPLEGVSRAGLARGEAGAAGAEATFAEWSDQIVVVGEGSWRLVWNPNRVATRAIAPDAQGEIAAEELYDLSRDPLQQANRAAQEPERVAALRRRACEFVSERDFRVREDEGIADDVRERLRALGYVDESPASAARDLASHCREMR